MTITLAQLVQNKWMAIHGRVYDISAFEDHPGGKEVLLALCGKDATADFEDVSHSDSARRLAATVFVGFLENSNVSSKNLPTLAEVSAVAVAAGGSLGLSTRTVVLSGMFALIGAIAAYFAFGTKHHSLFCCVSLCLTKFRVLRIS
jgi:cytochrome b involved in lipid metabolism